MWSLHVYVFWGWECEKISHEKKSDKIKYNQDNGKPYHVMEHSHDTIEIEGVEVFSDDYVYEEHYGNFKLYEDSQSSPTLYWGAKSESHSLDYGLGAEIDPTIPSHVKNLKDHYQLPEPKFYIVGK